MTWNFGKSVEELFDGGLWNGLKQTGSEARNQFFREANPANKASPAGGGVSDPNDPRTMEEFETWSKNNPSDRIIVKTVPNKYGGVDTVYSDGSMVSSTGTAPFTPQPKVAASDLYKNPQTPLPYGQTNIPQDLGSAQGMKAIAFNNNPEGYNTNPWLNMR